MAENITEKLYHLFGLEGAYLFFGKTHPGLLGSVPKVKSGSSLVDTNGAWESLKDGQSYFLGKAVDFGGKVTHKKKSVYLSVPLRERADFLGTLDLIAKPGSTFSESLFSEVRKN